RLDGLREDELLDLGVEEERDEEDQRRPREDRQERADDRYAPRRDRERDSDDDRARDQHERAVDARALQRLNAEDGGECAEEHLVEHDGLASRDELHEQLDPEQDQRRRERDDEREED